MQVMRLDGNKMPIASQPRSKFEHGAAARAWDLPTLGAIFGLAGGVVCVLFGSIFYAATWVTGTEGAGGHLRLVASVALMLTIPLLVFGAHCLDIAEKRKRAETERRLK